MGGHCRGLLLKGDHCRGWLLMGGHCRGLLLKGDHCRGWLLMGDHCRGWLLMGGHCRGWLLMGGHCRGWLLMGGHCRGWLLITASTTQRKRTTCICRGGNDDNFCFAILMLTCDVRSRSLYLPTQHRRAELRTLPARLLWLRTGGHARRLQGVSLPRQWGVRGNDQRGGGLYQLQGGVHRYDWGLISSSSIYSGSVRGLDSFEKP